MVKIVFIEHSGEQHPVEVTPGGTLMEAAIDNAVPGIDADCGGCCSCATCHVFVEDQWLNKLAPMGPNEEAMLSLSPDRKENSRLSCQVPIVDTLDGMVVKTPEFQF